MDTRKREKLSPSHNVCVFIIVNRIKATAKNERNNDNNGVLLFFLKKSNDDDTFSLLIKEKNIQTS